MSSAPSAATTNALWQKQPKANAEFFALTYGALVAELVRDLEDNASIQTELDRMGHSMGIRCIEEVLAKSDLKVGNMFEETKEVVKVAMKLFLGLTVDISDGEDENQFVARFTENPLTIFVELPEDRKQLEYCQLLAGMIRGMLEMLQFDCECAISSLCQGKPDEIVVTLKQVMQRGAGEEYQEE